MLAAVANHPMLLWLGINVRNVADRTTAERAGFTHEFTTAHYRIESGDDVRIDLQKHMMRFRRIAAA